MPCVMLTDDGECKSKYGVCVGWAKYDNEHPDAGFDEYCKQVVDKPEY